MSRTVRFGLSASGLLLLAAAGAYRAFDSGQKAAPPAASPVFPMPEVASPRPAGAAAFVPEGVIAKAPASQTDQNSHSSTRLPMSYTPSQFQALSAKILRELPTSAAMRDLTEEEAHGYPEPLAKAGPLLGKIAQAVQSQPELKELATDFYVSCTQDRDILEPARALCYSHILTDPKAPRAEDLPPEVVRLAKLIPAEGP